MANTDETKRDETHVFDCVVIGGGLSGLGAALYLKDSNISNICLLEARDRVGGRTCTEYVTLDNGESCYYDAGGAYVGPTQNRILRLARRYDIRTFHVNMKGKTTLNYNGRVSTYDGVIPNAGILSLLDLNHIFRETNRLSKLIDTSNIWNSKLSKEEILEYDRMSAREWVYSMIMNQESRDQYCDAMASLLCVNASEVSMLAWLKYCAAGDSVQRLIETENGAQERKFVGGSMNISVEISNELNKDLGKNTVRLNHIVKSINHSENNDFVTIIAKNTQTPNKPIFETLKARYVICAIPPTLYRSIEWTPKLSWQRDSLGQRMAMGSIIKTNTYFKTAFWRENGQNGMSFTSCDIPYKNATIDNNNEMPIITTFDDCKPDINHPFPSLMGFILSDNARNLTQKYTKDERKQLVLSQYFQLFGKDQRCFDECIGYTEKLWHDEEYSGGCYVGLSGNNLISQKCYDNIINLTALCKEHESLNLEILKNFNEDNNIKIDESKIKYCECPNEGKRIYFAGTELAGSWLGYMDGAIQSGERAANKIGNLLFDDLNKYLKESESHGFNTIDLIPYYGELAEPCIFSFKGNEKDFENYGIAVKPFPQSFVEEKLLPSVKQLIVIIICVIVVLFSYIYHMFFK